MDVDLSSLAESPDAAGDASERRGVRLNTMVALTVALLATFTGICKVKDENIVQAMQQAQADKLDHWSFYQARNIRQDLAEAEATQVRLAKAGAPASAAAGYDEAIAKYDAKAAAEAKKKQELKTQADDDQKLYDGLNIHDDQFDLSDAAIAIAIAMLAMTALTRAWWLYWAALLPTAFGVVMGLAGLFGWQLHPDALTRLLS